MYRDPLELFEAVRTLERQDWPSVARLCDPVGLSVFHTEAIEPFRPPPHPVARSAESDLAQYPEMPVAVAEYFMVRASRTP